MRLIHKKKKKRGLLKRFWVSSRRHLLGLESFTPQAQTASVILIDVHPGRNADLADICAYFNWLKHQVWGITAVLRFTKEIVPLKDTMHHLYVTLLPLTLCVCRLHMCQSKHEALIASLGLFRWKKSTACGENKKTIPWNNNFPCY